jgi:hypothetical protein
MNITQDDLNIALQAVFGGLLTVSTHVSTTTAKQAPDRHREIIELLSTGAGSLEFVVHPDPASVVVQVRVDDDLTLELARYKIPSLPGVH